MEFGEMENKLRGSFGESIREAVTGKGDPWINVDASRITDIAGFLKADPGLDFDILVLVTGVDFPEEQRMEVVYHFLSTTKAHRLTLKASLSRENPECPSLSGIYPASLWHEREVYDMLGIKFSGHPDMRRILCPEDWEGHPLRKDYEFPGEYDGIPAD